MLSASLQHPPKPAGRAMIVGVASAGVRAQQVMHEAGYEVESVESPYAAMLELCRRPLVYRTLVLSLQGLYRDELAIIAAVRRRFPHVSVWVSNTDGRQSALAEAMRLGAEAIVADDAIHPLNDDPVITPPSAPAKPMQFRPVPTQAEYAVDKPLSLSASTVAMLDSSPNEPVLSADELRALLGDELS